MVSFQAVSGQGLSLGPGPCSMRARPCGARACSETPNKVRSCRAAPRGAPAQPGDDLAGRGVRGGHPGAGFWTREWVLGADQGQLDAATVFRPQVQDTLPAPVPPEKDWTCSECPELLELQTCCLYRPFAHRLDLQKTLKALICLPPELCAGSET